MPYITVVMYHYVRDLLHSRYPEIKGLDISLFKAQMQYFSRHYVFIRMEELLAAVAGRGHLPDRALLLTFDDGYRDHFDYVFPVLDAWGVQGSFFVPGQVVQDHTVLDVNKIHFILAACQNTDFLVKDIREMLEECRGLYGLASFEDFRGRLRTEVSRFDTPDVIFVKRMLQRELPSSLRSALLNKLFNKYVSADEGTFSRELYMDMDQLKCLRNRGMYIGGHGYRHEWLDTLSQEDQLSEVQLSQQFLTSLGCDKDAFVFCYPYGANNASLRTVLRDAGCRLALTTQPGLGTMDGDPLVFPRLDTNDFPKDAMADPAGWTLKILQA